MQQLLPQLHNITLPDITIHYVTIKDYNFSSIMYILYHITELCYTLIC